MCHGLGASVAQKEDSEEGTALPGWGAPALGRDTPPALLLLCRMAQPSEAALLRLWLDPLTAPNSSGRISKLSA